MLQVVIPAAGLGSRFKTEGYTKIKPLIDVGGRPMISAVIESMEIPDGSTLIVIKPDLQGQDDLEFDNAVNRFKDRFSVIIHRQTVPPEGAAHTISLVKHHLLMTHPLIVCDSDMIHNNPDLFWSAVHNMNTKVNGLDTDPGFKTLGIIPYIFDDNPACSYLVTNHSGAVMRTAEKMVISDKRIVGVHAWRHAQTFFYAYEKCRENKTTYNNEYYVSLVWNYIVDQGRVIPVEFSKNSFSSIGVPSELRSYLTKNAHANK